MTPHKNSLMLSEGEREVRLTRAFRRVEVEGPRWPEQRRAPNRKVSRPGGELAFPEVSRIRSDIFL